MELKKRMMRKSENCVVLFRIVESHHDQLLSMTKRWCLRILLFTIPVVVDGGYLYCDAVNRCVVDNIVVVVVVIMLSLSLLSFSLD